MKRVLSLVGLAAACTSALAAGHYVITPLGAARTATEAEPIVVSLQAATLPSGTVGVPYAFDMTSLLLVTGDPALDLSLASWVANTPVPPGLSLDSEGLLTGTPTTKTAAPASFEVVASYKGQNGQQVYTILVNGVELQATQIAVGSRHSCVITPEGAVKCWGRNSEGQLGDGTTTNRSAPTQVAGLPSGVTSLSAGEEHTCAIVSGAALCWGANGNGRLGDGTSAMRTSPTQVVGLTSGVTALSAGVWHTCAVVSGAAICWGSNAVYGQLGDGTTSDRYTPTPVSGLTSGVTSVASGLTHSCAVVSGAATCWGTNTWGQLGDGTTTTRRTPIQVLGLESGVTAIGAGNNHNCAIKSGGVQCWGQNYGKLGDGTTTVSRSTAGPVSGLTSGVADIALGAYHSCALTSGVAWCWGHNASGQVGDGTTVTQSAPVQITGLASGVASIQGGVDHACALVAGKVSCWGKNEYGQLGTGTTTNSLVPVDVLP